MKSRSRLAFVLVAAALGSGGAAGCASSSSSEERASHAQHAEKSGPHTVGDPMPQLMVKTLEGNRQINLGRQRGKVVLVDIWASWCAPCMEEMPLLDEMAARLKNQGVEIIAVSVDEDRESATAFLSKRSRWTLTVAHDPTGKVPEVLQPAKMPTSYVVDGEGIIRYVNEGFERADIKKLEARLKALVAAS